MKKSRKKKDFVYKPIFKGGGKAFKQHIYGQLRYPAEARRAGIEGVVRVRYKIDHHGQVTETKILTSLGHGCDEEAIRVIKTLRFEVPKSYKRKVAFYKTTNIAFKKPKEKRPHTQTVSYTITPSKATDQTDPTSNKDKSYSYTINWPSNDFGGI